MKVAIVGHRKIEKTERIVSLTKETIEQLIRDGADTFIFGSKSEFDDLCYDIVTSLKDLHELRRIYVRSSFQYIDEVYKDYLLTLYEETFFPESVEGAGVLSYVKRNEVMIDMCDVLLTYYNQRYIPSQSRYKVHSGTALSVKFAEKKGKKIINIYE